VGRNDPHEWERLGPRPGNFVIRTPRIRVFRGACGVHGAEGEEKARTKPPRHGRRRFESFVYELPRRGKVLRGAKPLRRQAERGSFAYLTLKKPGIVMRTGSGPRSEREGSNDLGGGGRSERASFTNTICFTQPHTRSPKNADGRPGCRERPRERNGFPGVRQVRGAKPPEGSE